LSSLDQTLPSLDLSRSQQRRRISPCVTRPRRPLRIRRRPRHFDSSPDLDLPRRCEGTDHFPSKMVRDFVDPHGRMHAICNECRGNCARARVHSILPLSSEEDENRTPQPVQPLTHNTQLSARPPLLTQSLPGRFGHFASLDIVLRVSEGTSGRFRIPLPARQPLQDVTARHVNIDPSQPNQQLPSRFCLFGSYMLSVSGGTYGRYRVSRDYTDIGLDNTNPTLWNQSTQTIVDGFRRRLTGYNIHFCPVCSRIQSFDPTFIKSLECSHCKNRRQHGQTSNFGAENDMDPGEV